MSNSNHLTGDIVNNLCNKEVSENEVEALIHSMNEVNSSDVYRMANGVSCDLKRLFNNIETIKTNNDVENIVDHLDSTIEKLIAKTDGLKKTMNTSNFASENLLLKACAAATRETIESLNGVVPVHPVTAGQKSRAFVSDVMRASNSVWNELIEDESINENLLFTEDDNDCTTSDFTCVDYFGELINDFHTISNKSSSHLYSSDIDKSFIDSNQLENYTDECDLRFFMPLLNIDKAIKERKQRKRATTTVEKLVTINKKDNLTVQSEEVSIMDELSKVRKSLKSVLKRRNTNQIPYYEFVMDPTDYSKTAENIFYVSYLIRYGEVFLTIDKNIPILKLAKLLSESETTELKRKCDRHAIASFSYKNWIKLRQIFPKACID